MRPAWPSIWRTRPDARTVPAERRGRRVVEAGLCLFAASLPISVAGANIGWAVAAAGLILAAWEGDTVDWRAWRGGLAAPLAFFLAAAAAATLVAPEPLDALKHLHKDAHKLWVYALLTTAFTVADPRRPLAAFGAGAAVAAVYGAAQWASALGDPSLVPRAHGWTHAVTYGEQMAVAFCGAACMLTAREGRSRFVWAAAALSGTALLMSNTRGAFAGAGAGLFAIGLAVPRLRRTALTACGVAAVAAVAIDLLTPQRSFIWAMLGQGHPAASVTQGQFARMTLWTAAWQMGLDHPWFGVGVGGFRALLPSYVAAGTRFDGGEASFGTAHNLYLHHFAERGLTGVLALGWLLWAYLSRAARRARESSDPRRLFGLAAAACFVMMNVTEVALHVELVWMLALFVWTAAEAREPSA